MAKRTRSSGIRRTTGKAMPGSLGEMLDQIGFQPLGRRIVVHRYEVPRVPHPSHWVGPVIEFLKLALPSARSGGWEHLDISAYEAACDGLVALGSAGDVDGGASPVSEPKLPVVFPRWDDIATVVVSLAGQAGLLEYRAFVSARDQTKATVVLRPNIRAANGSGPAYLASEAFPAFLSLGMVLDGRWTDIAETILWRDFPDAWGIDFTEDHRFIAACNEALTSVPDDVAADIKRLATVSDEDINEWIELAERHAPTPKTREDALKSLYFWARFGLDRLFHKRWRLSDGWLSVDESKRALIIQHDPVAIHMRGEFMSRYMPESPFLAE